LANLLDSIPIERKISMERKFAANRPFEKVVLEAGVSTIEARTFLTFLLKERRLPKNCVYVLAAKRAALARKKVVESKRKAPARRTRRA